MGNKRCEKAEGSGALCAMRVSFEGVDHLLYLVLIDVREASQQLHAAPHRQKRRSVQFPEGKRATKRGHGQKIKKNKKKKQYPSWNLPVRNIYSCEKKGETSNSSP